MGKDVIESFICGLVAFKVTETERQDEVLKIADENGIRWQGGQRSTEYKPYSYGLKDIYLYIVKGKLIYSIKNPNLFKRIRVLGV